GSVAEGFKAADAVHEMTYSTSRVQHVHLETHGSIAWRGDDGRLHIRTSTQAPFIAQQKLCHIFGLRAREVHVFTERVGGGFGGQVPVASTTGAYGGHAGETLAAALGSPLSTYRCANKKAIGYAVYTNMVPAGGFRGYGSSQTTYAIECAMDELARLLDI